MRLFERKHTQRVVGRRARRLRHRAEPEKPSADNLPATIALFAFVIVLLSPAFLTMLWFIPPSSSRGTEPFFTAAAGVLSAVGIAVALQFHALLGGSLRAARGDRWLVLLLLLSYVFSLGLGISQSLTALNSCGPETCGTNAQFTNVVWALIAGGSVLLGVVLLSVYEVLRSHRPDNARTRLDARVPSRKLRSEVQMSVSREIELVLEPQEEGGYHVYAPDLPGLHTQGSDVEDALRNAEEAVALYVEGLREDGQSLETGIIRRKVSLPA